MRAQCTLSTFIDFLFELKQEQWDTIVRQDWNTECDRFWQENVDSFRRKPDSDRHVNTSGCPSYIILNLDVKHPRESGRIIVANVSKNSNWLSWSPALFGWTNRPFYWLQWWGTGNQWEQSEPDYGLHWNNRKLLNGWNGSLLWNGGKITGRTFLVTNCWKWRAMSDHT